MSGSTGVQNNFGLCVADGLHETGRGDVFAAISGMLYVRRDGKSVSVWPRPITTVGMYSSECTHFFLTLVTHLFFSGGASV